MGLSASVRCRCWEEGRTSEPPIPRDRIEIGELDMLAVAGPWDGTAEAAVSKWVYSGDACAHDRMQVADEGIGNWAAVRMFQDTLRAAGEENFPVLTTHLPNGTDGLIPPRRRRRHWPSCVSW